MGISVPGLLNFRGDRWQVAADLLRSSARGSTAQADSLRAAADAMSKAWSDEIGAMIAERCRQQADLVEQQATSLPPLADALDAGAAQMQDLSTEMLKLVERAAAADVVVTDDGGARPAFDLGLLDPREAAKRIAIANAVRAVAISILQRADLVDRRVPEDVSVVGFDDLNVSAFLPTPLTTVRQDFHRIGEELVRLVVEQIRSTTRLSQPRVIIPTGLVVRGRTAAPSR